MSKINILFLERNQSGVNYHRIRQPHAAMMAHADLEDKIQMYNAPDIVNVPTDILKKIDVVVFNRVFPSSVRYEAAAERLKDMGCKIVSDFDDNWVLPKNHLLYDMWNRPRFYGHTFPESAELTMKISDAITTTHEYLAEDIRTVVPDADITLVPNALNLHLDQWDTYKMMSFCPVRIGWSGSQYHEEDIEILRPVFRKLYSKAKYKGKFEVHLAGYQKMDVWERFVKIFKGGKLNPDNFYLHNVKDINTYGTLYENFDISLIPLADNHFNASKSNLKWQESTIKGAACIASNVHPYNEDIVSGENGMLCSNDSKEWLDAIDRLMDPDECRVMRKKSMERVLDLYDLDDMAMRRYELYQRLIETK